MAVVGDKFYQARITRREDFAPDLWMIRIQADGEFKFAPGQYATLGVEHDGKRTERPYSIVSAPFENELEFFFEDDISCLARCLEALVTGSVLHHVARAYPHFSPQFVVKMSSSLEIIPLFISHHCCFNQSIDQLVRFRSADTIAGKTVQSD